MENHGKTWQIYLYSISKILYTYFVQNFTLITNFESNIEYFDILTLKFSKNIIFFKFKILKNFFLDLGNTYHRDFFLTGSLNFELYNEKKIKSKFWSEPYKPGSVSKILPRKNDLFSKKNFSNFWNYFFKKNFFFIKFTCLRI